jgi:TolA-binding protein
VTDRTPPRPLLSALAFLTLLAGCDRRPAPAATPERNAAVGQDLDTEADQIAAIEKRVRLEQVEKRLAALEMEVGEMRTTPQSLELDLVKRRLEALEARVYAKPSANAPPTEPANSTDPSSSRR